MKTVGLRTYSSVLRVPAQGRGDGPTACPPPRHPSGTLEYRRTAFSSSGSSPPSSRIRRIGHPLRDPLPDDPPTSCDPHADHRLLVSVRTSGRRAVCDPVRSKNGDESAPLCACRRSILAPPTWRSGLDRERERRESDPAGSVARGRGAPGSLRRRLGARARDRAAGPIG